MSKFFILIFLSLISISASSQKVEDINKARLEKRFEDAFNISKTLADKGNDQAQFFLAIAYLQGQGVEKNDYEAFKWMKSSAEAGNRNAIYGLSTLYQKGQGTPLDLKLSFNYKEKAALLWLPAAQYDIGLAYLNGNGTEKDIVLAKYWLERVAAINDNSPYLTQLKGKAKDALASMSEKNAKENTNYPNGTSLSVNQNPVSNSSISPAPFNSKLLRPGLMPNDPRLSCISAFDNNLKFQVLNGKIGTTIFWDISFPMLSNQAVPTAKEQQAIAYWADELRTCISDSSAYRQKNYNRELLSLLDKEDEQLQEAAIDLYNKKSTYGKYNSRVQQIFKESKVALDNFQQNKADQEEQFRARAAAMRDAQQRQEQQRMTEQRQAEQRRQAEQSRIAAVRQQWQARCELDKRNAYEQYTKSKENTCNGPNKGLAILCVTGNIAAANDYADAAFKSCMSGAPVE